MNTRQACRREWDTNLLGCLVEHLALGGQRIRSVNQIVQLLSSLQDGFDGFVLMNKMSSLFLEADKVNTSTILVSSSSCCTRMIVSACLGSWYFWMYVLMSGNEMEAGSLNDVWGTLAVKSSNSFVKSEKAGRTGYSWSVIITAKASLNYCACQT